MKNAVGAVLASPKFVYVVEAKRGAGEKSSLSGYELAQRLALFIWSSIPDEPLMETARKCELQKLHRKHPLRTKNLHLHK